MQKIALIAHGLGNGGAERVASILANGLSRKNYEVMYLAVYNNVITYNLDADIKYIYLNIDVPNKIKKYIDRSKKISKILDDFQPDFVISFIVQEMLLTSFKGKYQIVYSERTDPASKSKLLRMATKWIYNKAYRVVFQTDNAKDYFDTNIRDKGVVIPNPINMDLPYWKENLHENVIVTACRITPEKNLPMLIKAFARFYDGHRDYILRICGEPRYPEIKNELIRLSEELGIREKIEYLGYCTDVHQVMSRATIFALTSNYEGLSNSMLEALCIGVPTICTDCPSGGAAMYIENGENGFLVGVNDVDALYQQMTILADDIELQEKISNNSVKLREQLAAENIIKQWMAVLH